MAEVLGRYSNHGAVGAGIGALRDRAAAETRDEPWARPRLVGATRVRRILATDLDAMVADYAAGMGCVLLSRKYGIAENTVLARLKEAGIEVRPQGFVDPHALEEMSALRAEGWTLKALGQRYGITRQTVAARLRG
ncbi:MAG: hypothetical protein QM655_01245 [Nocardioidaceae bacterium]